MHEDRKYLFSTSKVIHRLCESGRMSGLVVSAFGTNEMSGSRASSQNFYGVELLVARHGGFESLFKFVSLYGASDNWTESFRSAFGISREDFYTEWYEYLGIPIAERPALTPAAIPAHN